MKNGQPWRPWTISRSGMVSFVGLCIGLLIVNELVIFGCNRHDHGCPIFGSSDDGSVPWLSTVVYNVLPIVISIALSLRWIIQHHDILRLEPYFQMSKESGALASSSLFLQYPYDLVFFLPYKALKNRHFIVALSSLILMLMNFVIVPIVPTLFDERILSSSIPAQALRIEFNSTARQVPANFTFSAYDYAWRNGTLAQFMTENYALLPVMPLPDVQGFLPRENWTVLTTKFEAELECETARLAQNYSYFPGNMSLIIEAFQTSSNGSTSASASAVVCDALQYSQEVIENRYGCGDHTAFLAPWASMYAALNKTVDMGTESSYMFAWAARLSPPLDWKDGVRSPHPANITGIFCTPKYYTQFVEATIAINTREVLNATLIGERTRIDALLGFDAIIEGNPIRNVSPDEVLFTENRTRSHPQVAPVRFGYPVDKIVDLRYDLEEKFGTPELEKQVIRDGLGRISNSNIFMTATDTLAAFSLYGKDNTTLVELLDPEKLRTTLEKALKLWFAFAVATESMQNGLKNTTIQVERIIPTPRISVNPRWSLGTRIGLPMLVVMAILLSYLLDGRPCNLEGEPNSIAAALKLLSASPALCAVMKHSEYHPLSNLMKELDKNKFHFIMSPSKEGALEIRVFGAVGNDALEVEPERLTLLDPPGQTDPVQKDAEFISPGLIAAGGLVFFPILIALLISTNKLSKKQGGFPMPGGPATFRSKILYDWLPVAVGIAAESFLILLGSTQCMTAPYKALMRGNAGIKALRVDFDRIPPHFQLAPAFKQRHYTLVALATAILFSNVLAAFLSAIFRHSPHVPRVSKRHDAHENITLARQEIVFQMDRNINSGYYPSWTTDGYYIDSPFQIAPFEGEGTYGTRGFGVDVKCELVPDDRIFFPCSNSTQYSTEDVDPEFSMGCPPEDTSSDNFMWITNPCGDLPRNAAMATWQGSCVDFIVNHYRCPSRIFSVWAENERYIPNRSLGIEDKYRYVVLNCSISNRVVNLRATVRDGKVLNVSDIHPTPPTPSDTETTISLAGSYAAALVSSSVSYMSQGTNHPLDRLNGLMALVDGSVVQGPDTHVPSGQVAVGTFAEVLERLFPLLVRLDAKTIFQVQYVVDSVEYRADVQMLNFGMALGILLFCFSVIVSLFIKQQVKVEMGHLPWSLAGLYTQLYASNAKDGIDSEVSEEVVYVYGEYPPALQQNSERHYGVYKYETAHSGEESV